MMTDREAELLLPAGVPSAVLLPSGGSPARRASLVAGVNALFRSRESRAPAPLIRDPYAHLFGERHPLIWGLRALRFALPPLRRMIDELQTAHCVRHRSIDELCLQAARRDGFQQIVILGAGYDSRALRLGPRLPGVRWFEVDHPATAARKTRLAARAGITWTAPRVMVDLQHDPLAPALASVGFDPAAPTCFVLEGLAHYLDRAAFRRLLAAAATPGRRRIVLSYIDRRMAARAPSLFVALVRLLREVPVTHFDRAELAALAGLTLTGHWTFSEQVEQLLEAGARPAPPLHQDVATLDA